MQEYYIKLSAHAIVEQDHIIEANSLEEAISKAKEDAISDGIWEYQELVDRSIDIISARVL